MKNPSDPPDRVKRLRSIRTEQLPPDGGEDFNRLVFEKSPYLLQHAENPLDWHPWNEDALEKARQEDKPVFLSIGYSTCHWCHVMERESFEDPEVAEVVNASFIPIKVDREERPDIDQVYMTACQLMTGSGGWPLTLILTPQLKPFFAATYLPKRSRGGMPGLVEILSKIAELWALDRQRLESAGNQAAEALKGLEKPPRASADPGDELLQLALNQYRQGFDSRLGGFGDAPKFPAPHNLSLLLRLGRRFGDPEGTRMALETLRAIRLGGIFDQIGFGLHRYSVDARWLVPHFEKMLYDQALAALAYLEAYQVSGDSFFSQTAGEIFSYVLRDLQDEAGGFFAGEDADSEGVEGRFYLWTPAQVESLLGEDLGRDACRYFGIVSNGHLDGASIPNRLHHPAPSRNRAGEPGMSLPEDLEKARQRLFREREKRPRPHRDEKIISGWNGLMIGALARGGAVLNRPDLIAAAERAAAAISDRQERKDGRLLRRWCHGQAAIPAFLDDYAFLAFGLTELFLASRLPRHLETARRLTGDAESLFGDGGDGYFDSGSDAEVVLARSRSWQDGALPAGISVTVLNQLRLGVITGDDRLTGRGERTLRLALGRAKTMPTAFSFLLGALDFYLAPRTEVTLPPRSNESPQGDVERAFRRIFCPEAIIPSPAKEETSGGEGKILVCRGHTCLPPVSDSRRLEEILNQGFPVKT